MIDYLEVQGVFLPKELQNLAGEPYTDGDSMKASAEANSEASSPEVSNVDSNNNFSSPATNTIVENNVNTGVNMTNVTTQNPNPAEVSTQSVNGTVADTTTGNSTENLFG